MDLVSEVYSITKDFPTAENFGLRQQIRKSAISIPSNIAEGCGKSTNKDLIRFLDISIGSLNELETQILISENLNYIKPKVGNDIIERILEIRKMIYGFRKIKSKN